MDKNRLDASALVVEQVVAVFFAVALIVMLSTRRGVPCASQSWTRRRRSVMIKRLLQFLQHQQQLSMLQRCHQQRQPAAKRIRQQQQQQHVHDRHLPLQTSGQYSLLVLPSVSPHASCCRWVCPSIRVRIIDRRIAGGKYYEEKVACPMWQVTVTSDVLQGTIMDVAGYRHVTIRMDRLVSYPAICVAINPATAELLFMTCVRSSWRLWCHGLVSSCSC